MGKGCVRFKKLEDLALDLFGRTVARVPVGEHMPITGWQERSWAARTASVWKARPLLRIRYGFLHLS
jgi:hypothetical protein